MAKCSCSILIRQQTNKRGAPASLSRIGGFSEGWWYDGDPGDAMTKLVIISQFRARCLTTCARVIGQRVRVFQGGSTTNNQSFPGSLDVRGDIPQMGLLCSVGGAGVANARKFIVRGVPDSRVEEGEYDPLDTYSIPLNAYVQQVDNQAFSFKAVDLTKPAVPVISISATGAVITGEPGTWSANTIVTGLRVSSDVTGKVIPFKLPIQPGADAFHWTLSGWDLGPASGGRIREFFTIYPRVDSAKFAPIRITTHKVGQDFFQFRGRASART